ncbi:MAG: AraC family transcriptional regulator, partial [Clostridia bacterium]|nr:AraC family transcriptional regulator [Clostridia bacterium]
TQCRVDCGKATVIRVEQASFPFSEITVIPDVRGEIAKIAEQARFYAQSQLTKKQLILSALGGLLTGFATAFAEDNNYSPVTQTVRSEILNNLSNVTFSLEATIKKLPLNYDYVRKLFQKEVGVTPREFLTRERMQLAECIIKSGISNQYSGYTVSQIAEACGFSEPLYFSRVFKKYFGVSPTEYK